MAFKENYRKPKKSKQYQTINKSEKIHGNNRKYSKPENSKGDEQKNKIDKDNQQN